jgi:hypothetical protein
MKRRKTMKKLFTSLIAVLFCLALAVSFVPTAWAENGVIQKNDVGIYDCGHDLDQIPIESWIITYKYIDKTTGSSNNGNLIATIVNESRRTVNFNPVTITGNVGKLLV